MDKHLEKKIDKLAGTADAKALIEYIKEIQEQLKNDLFTSEDVSIEELVGRKIAKVYLDKIIRRLSSEKKEVKKNEYL